ncbi:nucleotidyltransferase family protein [Kribbella solani]|uniref:nucleotidyltransferase family protein n=1 Tax=Kribbella solani TaxID=236067 RepID=UPI0029BD41AB|nr:nucleotidyltransferase family protein [Kribbella solani]MDX2972182.1 nucleotidyltransferase family protein [Kribbella solani]
MSRTNVDSCERRGGLVRHLFPGSEKPAEREGRPIAEYDNSIDTESLLATSLEQILAITGADLAYFARLIEYHRIAPRLASSEALMSGAVNEYHRRVIIKIAQSQIGRWRANRNSIRELAGFLTGSAVLQLKGTTVSELLGGGVAYARASSDLDLMIEDGAERLKSAGYTKSTVGVCHELGGFSKVGQSKIDLHDHFPIWNAEVSPWRFSGATREALMPLSIESTSDGFRILCMEAAAMAIAAAIYRDAVEHPLWRPAMVRLCDVIDYAELTNDARFDGDLFSTISQEFQAVHCADFVARIIELLSNRGAKSSEDSPRELARGIFVVPPLAADVLLRPSAAFDAALSSVDTLCSWDGGRPVPGISRLQLGSNAGSATVSDVPNGIRVSHLIVGGDYKEELRLTTRGGSSAVQLDHRSGHVFLRSSGPGLRLKAATCDGDSLSMQVELEAPSDHMIVSHSNMIGTMNTSWLDFYSGLESSVEVVEMKGHSSGW